MDDVYVKYSEGLWQAFLVNTDKRVHYSHYYHRLRDDLRRMGYFVVVVYQRG